MGQLVFSVPGGVLGDRFDRRRVLMFSQLVPGVAVLGLAALVLTGQVRVWQVLAFAMLAGLASAAEKPASSGLLYDTVGEARLLNASAFRFMAGSLVRIVGAVAGGYIIDRLGIGQNFLLAAVAYMAAGGCVLGVSTPRTIVRAAEPIAAAIVAGFRYALRTADVRRFLWLSLVTEGFGFSYGTMMPVMAKDVLHVGSVGLGYLTASGGLGQLLATLVVAARGHLMDRSRLAVVGAVGFGLAIALFALVPWFAASLVLAGLVGMMGSVYDSGMATVLLAAASDAMRARVQGLYVATIGFNQIGGFGVGALATLVGAPLALAASGVVAAAGAIALLPRVFGAVESGSATISSSGSG
jgi:MFS family permease